MSIYASLAAPSDDPGDDAPIIYQGSHILPADTDPRGGWIDIALIPSHITRDGRDDRPEDEAPWPFLRFGVNDETVVLTPRHVRSIVGTLTWWLESAAGESKP